MKIKYKKPTTRPFNNYRYWTFTIDRDSTCGNYSISKQDDTGLYHIYFEGFFVEVEKLGMNNEFKTLKAAKLAVQNHHNKITQ